MAHGKSRTTRLRKHYRWHVAILVRTFESTLEHSLIPDRYDACDVGALPNQTFVDGTNGPPAAHNVPAPYGRSGNNFDLSWLPGQRLS